MSGIQYVLHSPTTPGNPGYSVDLSVPAVEQGVRLGDMPGLITEAELGAVGISSARIDDPAGTAGNGTDGIPGLKQLSVNEGRAPSGNRRIGEFYITDRHYSRGDQGVSPSLITGVERIVDITLADINSFLSFRIFRNGSNTSFNRPAETDVARVQAMLSVSFLSDTLFDGLVGTSSTVAMDAVDYTGQRPSDVLNDCAQQSGKNFFVFYDEAGTYTPSPGDYGLFYDFNTSTVYPSYDPAFQVSNVLADVNLDSGNNPIGPVWEPVNRDAVLIRDPSRVVSGVFIQNGSNSVYRESPATSYEFGWRDAVTSSPNLKTVAAMTARADRYLSENASEDDRISFTLKLPAANVNDWKEGQWAQVKFSHLPGYETFTTVRALVRTVLQSETTPDWYDVHYEVTPMTTTGEPGGAFAQGPFVGVGIPILRLPTTPGNVLLLMVTCSTGPVTAAPIGPPVLTDWPSVDPLHPPLCGSTPGLAGWTVLGTDSTDVAGMPGTGCDGNFAISTTILWRYVQPGEVTVNPVAVCVAADATSGQGGPNVAAWLWHLPTTTPPTAGSTFHTPICAPPAPGTFSLPSNTGNSVGIIAWNFFRSGTELADWAAVSGTTVQSSLMDGTVVNNTTTGWNAPWNWIGQLPAGGVLSASMHSIPFYTGIPACGVVVTLPAGITLPTIPYPANQT